MTQRGWLWASVRVVLGLALLNGCGTQGFRVDGALTSEGGALGSWSWRPQGCIRASGENVAGQGLKLKPAASLLWIDPVRRDGSRANGQRFAGLDAPVRLDLSRAGGEPMAVLETVRSLGTEFSRRNCRMLTLETEEQSSGWPGRRPAVGGRLRMDCEVRGSHVTADVRFDGCGY